MYIYKTSLILAFSMISFFFENRGNDKTSSLPKISVCFAIVAHAGLVESTVDLWYKLAVRIQSFRWYRNACAIFT